MKRKGKGVPARHSEILCLLEIFITIRLNQNWKHFSVGQKRFFPQQEVFSTFSRGSIALPL